MNSKIIDFQQVWILIGSANKRVKLTHTPISILTICICFSRYLQQFLCSWVGVLMLLWTFWRVGNIINSTFFEYIQLLTHVRNSSLHKSLRHKWPWNSAKENKTFLRSCESSSQNCLPGFRSDATAYPREIRKFLVWGFREWTHTQAVRIMPLFFSWL